MSTEPLRRRLAHRVPLELPAYAREVPAGLVVQHAFGPQSAQAWYESIRDRLLQASGYLPIYRISDGEFVFVCGRRAYPPAFLLRYPVLTLKSWARALVPPSSVAFLSGSKAHGFESYTDEEWARAKDGYGPRVKAIAEKGVLAINFVHHLWFPEQYVAPMCNWLDEHQVPVTPANYAPFYLIYAFLLGPDVRRLMAGRRVLVVTSDATGAKAPAIERTLRRLGAEAVVFVPISRSKSMFDRIEVGNLGQIDLVLIGAGVGAINVLEQVEPLGALSIDAGAVLDCYWQPERFVGRRAFTRPDAGSPLLP
jgi:hypothetical protein